MLQPILVPLDGSDLAEQALPYAEALAVPGCQLILLEVGQDEDEFSALERHADSCARLETAVGDPAQQILQVARDLGVGLIVMTTHGRGALGRWAIGSVADTVTRSAPIPVLVVRARPDTAATPPMFERVVVPLDGSPLAERALPVAQSLAQHLQIPAHLITAVDVTSLLPVELTPPVAFDGVLYEETVAQLKSDAEGWLTAAAEQLRRAGVTVTWEVLSGSPFLVIGDAVAPGDLLVMASHGRSGAERWLLGSVAEKLIREAPVPVVLVPTADRQGERDAIAAAVPAMTRTEVLQRRSSRRRAMFDRILVPLDGSETAEAALAYAELLPSRQWRLQAVAHEREDLTAMSNSARDCEAYLERVAEPLRQRGRDVETTVRYGNPAERSLASGATADIEVMGSHGHGAGERLVLGSVAEQVAIAAGAPVLLVRAPARDPLHTAVSNESASGSVS